jgi:hypothetical protein
MNDKDREFISEEGRRINAMPVLSSLEEMLEEDFSAWCKTAEFPDYADFILVKFFGQSNPYSINEVNRFY